MEFFDALGCDPSFLHITPGGFGLGRFDKAMMILFFGPDHGPIQGPFIESPARRSLRANFRPFQRDARPIGQHGHRLGKRHAFHLHEKREDIAADIADPAFERLTLGIDLQTGPGVLVPGAEAHVVASLTAQLNMAADKLDNVDSLFDSFFGVER